MKFFAPLVLSGALLLAGCSQPEAPATASPPAESTPVATPAEEAAAPTPAVEAQGLLDDTEKNVYDIRFENLLGRQDTVHHDGSAWSRVDDAALWALQSMSRSLDGAKFDYGKIDHKKVDEDIAKEKARAREWFEANKGTLQG